MGVQQERMAAPFSCTVHAPHSAMPHPNFVPVSPGHVAQIPKQRHVGIAVKRLFLPVYLKTDHVRPSVNYGGCKIDFHILVAVRQMWKSIRS